MISTDIFGLSNRMDGSIYRNGAPGLAQCLRPAFPRRQSPAVGVRGARTRQSRSLLRSFFVEPSLCLASNTIHHPLEPPPLP